jgi:hypothetical protein
MTQLFTDRMRGNCTYTQASNTMFQGLGADCALRALWYLSRACYTDRNSPLFGCRPVNFAHDEFFVEIPEDDRMHERAEALKKIVLDGANELLPDVKTKTSPVIMRYWSKEAHEITDTRGRLEPWPSAVCNCKACKAATARS